jgi:hypothetical protein
MAVLGDFYYLRTGDYLMNNEVMVSDKLNSQIAEIACNYVVSEFIDGQRDCRDGKPHFDGKGESYDAGYSAQYQLEQIQSTGVN